MVNSLLTLEVLVTSQTTRALGKLQSDTTGKRPYLKQRQTNGLKRERITLVNARLQTVV